MLVVQIHSVHCILLLLNPHSNQISQRVPAIRTHSNIPQIQDIQTQH